MFKRNSNATVIAKGTFRGGEIEPGSFHGGWDPSMCSRARRKDDEQTTNEENDDKEDGSSEDESESTTEPVAAKAA